MTATTSKADAAPVATPDALALLKADHHEVKALFASFESADHDTQGPIASQICGTLSVHTQIEEEIFYPAARAALGAKGGDLLDEALVEHGSAKDLIAQIETFGPRGTLFQAWVKVLGEYIQHHVKEEEGEIFPKLRGSTMDLKALGAKMATRKAELTDAIARDSAKARDADVSAAPVAARHSGPKSDGAKSPSRL